jgi:translation initiation factor 1
MKEKRRIVYSTDSGRHCPECGRPVARCECGKARPPAGDGIVRLQRQVKGRNGKPVIVITGLSLPEAELKAVAKRLKSKCAVGGTVENGTIVIQGDKRDQIKAELQSMNYTVK